MKIECSLQTSLTLCFHFLPFLNLSLSLSLYFCHSFTCNFLSSTDSAPSFLSSFLFFVFERIPIKFQFSAAHINLFLPQSWSTPAAASLAWIDQVNERYFPFAFPSTCYTWAIFESKTWKCTQSWSSVQPSFKHSKGKHRHGNDGGWTPQTVHTQSDHREPWAER